MPERPGLRPVSLPDLAQAVPSVQKQIRERHESLMERIGKVDSSPIELGDEYGEMGRLFMAADYPDAAEAAFLNAHTLVPEDFRWVYYLGHIYRTKGEVAQSAVFFEQAMQLRPNDVSSLVWLGEMYLVQGRNDAAEPLFARALSINPDSLSARFGLGRIALAKQDHRSAVRLLEDVLARDPQAASAHYPLSLAYRALGNSAQADAHLRLRRDHEILPADPLMVELEELLRSPQAYETRGIRSLNSGDWVAAASYFRKGLELAPDDPSLRHRLGTALFMAGNVRAARESFEEILRGSPDYARAHYSLGVLSAADGRHAEAVERFSAALRTEPTYLDARLRLANSLRRIQRVRESLPHYEQVFRADPQLSEAQFGHAMALVQLEQYQDARRRLEEGMKAFPDQEVFAHALARVLAAAPDDRVRDGSQALRMTEELLKKQKTLELGETIAMALAEVGLFEQAAGLQRELIASAEGEQRSDLARHLTKALLLYERREPSRTPWAEDQIP